MSYQQLPPDMKRKLAETVEPAEVLELCKTVRCDWKRLLNLNYDFVTQGFAIGATYQEKFQYLAERVSKNIGVETPQIVFVHFNAIPFGEQRFFERNYDYLKNEDEETRQQEINYDQENLKSERSSILRQIRDSPGVEWLREDPYNVWILVKDPEALPEDFTVEYKDRRGILRDNIVFDYPSERNEEFSEQKYPGNPEYNLEDLEELLTKPEDTTFNVYVEELLSETNLGITDEWFVYDLMMSDFSRAQAELFVKVAKTKDPYKSLIKIKSQLMGEKPLIVYENGQAILKFMVTAKHTQTDIQNYFQKKFPKRKIYFFSGKVYQKDYDYDKVDKIVLQ